MENLQGNISTIATWLAILITPIIINYGIDIDQATLTTFIYTGILIIIAVWSSYNPNTFKFLQNNKVFVVEDEETVMNDEYVYPEEE
jgi:hypothetical protein